MAACMLFTVGCFSRVTTTNGRDIFYLMRGVSSKQGLTTLFSRLANVQKGVRIPHLRPAGDNLHVPHVCKHGDSTKHTVSADGVPRTLSLRGMQAATGGIIFMIASVFLTGAEDVPTKLLGTFTKLKAWAQLAEA